jgi:hypothetical protein
MPASAQAVMLKQITCQEKSGTGFFFKALTLLPVCGLIGKFF